MLEPPEEYDLGNAGDTDEINRLAAGLAAWALRQGMDEAEVVDWVLDQPREHKLPRGSSGKLNPTAHHVRKGAEYAVDTFDPVAARPVYDAAPVEALRKRIRTTKPRHEKYLLGVLALCDKYQSHTPVVTGPNLAEVVGVHAVSAGEILAIWSRTYAEGFFTKVTYDGVRGHGRVWHVNVEWEPTAPVRHEKGCPRGTRCKCARLSQRSLSILTADNIDKEKRDTFEHWLQQLPPRSPVTVTDVCKATGLTPYRAKEHLREAEGTELLVEGTFPGGWVRRNGSRVRQGETWFTPDGRA